MTFCHRQPTHHKKSVKGKSTNSFEFIKDAGQAITKLLSKLTKMSLKSPYAVILLIRIACKMIEEEDGDSSSPYFDFVESCLRHKSEMVIYEAAHAIVNMKKTTSRS